ncbi:MAG: hypothetical protein OEY52_11140 [Gammaproteobacteria bacterium]|nr:hypothetical protein [Gammaproteobacteria bacterium]
MFIKQHQLIIYLFIYSISLCSATEEDSPFRVHGFVSQSYIYTDHNNFFGDQNGNGSLDFREIGFNTSYRMLPQLRFSGQVLSRNAGHVNDSDPRIDYALMDYRAIDNTNINAGIRAGRVKIPIGFYNDTRDVAHTRNGILLPQSVYIASLRDMFLAADGGSLYMNNSSDFGNVGFSYHSGNPVISKEGKTELEYILLTVNDPGNFEAEPFELYRLDYTSINERFRLAWTRAEVDFRYVSAPNSIIPPGNISILANIYSMQFNLNKFDFTIEYMDGMNTISNFSPVIPNQTVNSQRYYYQIDYHFIEKWNLYLRFDHTHKNKDDPMGKKYAQQTGKPAHTQFAMDRTIGLRWHHSTNMMFGFEYHIIEGTGWLSPQENPDPTKTKKDWNMLMLQAAYRF